MMIARRPLNSSLNVTIFRLHATLRQMMTVWSLKWLICLLEKWGRECYGENWNCNAGKGKTQIGMSQYIQGIYSTAQYTFESWSKCWNWKCNVVNRKKQLKRHNPRHLDCKLTSAHLDALWCYLPTDSSCQKKCKKMCFSRQVKWINLLRNPPTRNTNKKIVEDTVEVLMRHRDRTGFQGCAAKNAI